ncbi:MULTISPECIES: 3-keto-disaccharide hydrolase [unclassified Mucilaginibacter]|uniref:3-keto-disaccharide hydrolase n=1 Tax=unclassified Mucilaginibacter TaxID=2617802 RepID=UPI000A867938|nr:MULTISPECIES: DUF1080 domain-containing protein [unclassified Mucilaginibacter]PLW89872.1 MAG: DUF1080 domain-containing protein [Mucilaginibacter sp.]HEK20880.1 DUF1080 domain-containing protein [Bacteroidota bacterium]
MKHKLILTALLCGGFYMANAQQAAKPEDTEKWEPVPPVVTPGKVMGDAPSDAVILFNGKTGLSEWVDVASGDAAKWDVKGDVLTVNKQYGNIETKKKFGNYQLHIEWKVPANISGTGQARGNSGVFLASIGKGDDGYELQVLDSYNNKTYVNGMAGSIYKQFIPLANPTRPPGSWNVYDVIWTAPTFDGDQLKTPARVTVIFNGVLVENNVELLGPTQYIGKPGYRKAHGDSPIKLQAHGDKSEPLSFRNIWVREIK